MENGKKKEEEVEEEEEEEERGRHLGLYAPAVLLALMVTSTHLTVCLHRSNLCNRISN